MALFLLRCFSNFSKPFKILNLFFTELGSSPSLALSVKLINVLSMRSSSNSLTKWKHNHIRFFPLHSCLCQCVEWRCPLGNKLLILLPDLPLFSFKYVPNVPPIFRSFSIPKCLSTILSYFSVKVPVPLGFIASQEVLLPLHSCPSCPHSSLHFKCLHRDAANSTPFKLVLVHSAPVPWFQSGEENAPERP